jgi:predicted ATPase
MRIDDCGCEELHLPRRVAITGGPGAGKTALLETVRRHFCRHVLVLPESAGILFSGGFPRRADTLGRMATQRAIYRVQDELERLALGDSNAALVLCDRGTVDGAAYWPGRAEEFFEEIGSSAASELTRYHAVIHLRTPADGHGYQPNGVRTETAAQAREIDARIEKVWSAHRRRFLISDQEDFLEKLRDALVALRMTLPDCCRGHAVSGVHTVHG